MNYLNRISPTSCLECALSAVSKSIFGPEYRSGDASRHSCAALDRGPAAIHAVPQQPCAHANAVPRRYNETQRCGELPESELLRLRFRHGSQLSHRLLNNALKQHPIDGSRYQVHYRQNPDFRVYHELVEANALARPGELFFASAEPRFREAIEQFLTLLIEKTDSAEAVRLLDYRQYYEYDMEVVEDDGRKTSVDHHSGKK